VPVKHTLCYAECRSNTSTGTTRRTRSSRRIAASGSRTSFFTSSVTTCSTILEHPNPERYAGQRIFVVQREDYVYLVPFVEDEHTVFLKTIIPSRKATMQHLGEEARRP
jgi:hypothetical protein